MSFELFSQCTETIQSNILESGKPFQVLAAEKRKERRTVSAMNTGSVSNNFETDLSSR